MQKVVKKGFALAVCALIMLCGILVPTLTASAEEATEKRYYDNYSISTYAVDTQYINYSDRTEDFITTDNRSPLYSANTDLSNSCGPTAGGIVVGFYDKYYANLIPNYTSYYPATGKYKTKDSTYIPALMQTLYTLMRTNVDDVGVSESDCKAGLKTYVEQQGYNLSYTSVKSGSSFQFDTVKNAINNNKVALLFCDEVTLIDIGFGDKYDAIVSMGVQGNHIMVAYGYSTVKYYNGKGVNFRTDNYLVVATGFSEPNTCYVQVNTTSWLDSGYVVTIS